MRLAQDAIYSKHRSIPSLKFEDQQLTSFAGLVVFQKLFETLELWTRIKACCQHLTQDRAYGHGTALQCLIVHILLGYRQLRDSTYYAGDPMVQRVLGLKRLPSVPTMSRLLGEFDERSIAAQQALNRELVLERLEKEHLTTLTLDFDGTVQSTKRHAEGSAVGFNKQHKGQRSYYPLCCTVAQTGQVYDLLHRQGNVHDSNGAIEFVRHCVGSVRERMAKVRLEVRLDSAFFSDAMIGCLEDLEVQYTISVPFERFVSLKSFIQERSWWWAMRGSEGQSHYFEKVWKPEKWDLYKRFIFIRNKVAKQRKGPIQLDLFEPVEEDYEYKVIVTNKKHGAGKVASFHEGRGYQEKIYGELKSQGQMGYIPCRKLVANKVYLLSTIIAHNLGRELQMQAQPPQRGTTEKRTVRWIFEGLETLRRTIVQRAGRLTRPQGKLTLTLSTNSAVENALTNYLEAFA